MIVCHFQRRPLAHTFSIERVFAAVRRAFPGWVDCRVAVCRYRGTNPFKLAYNIVEARLRTCGINHITGDVSYLTLLLRKSRTILTIHDCVGMVRLTGWRRRLYRWWWLGLPVRRCAAVTVISERTKHEVMQYTGCPEEKIRIVPDAVGEEFQPSPRAFHTRMPVILQVGAGQNKNLGRVTAALRGIRCELHVVGNLAESDRRNLAGAGIRYRNSQGLNDDQMADAYRECDLVVFASTYEGFGMPVIEGQAVGRPVVTSCMEPMVSVAEGPPAWWILTMRSLSVPEYSASSRTGVTAKNWCGADSKMSNVQAPGRRRGLSRNIPGCRADIRERRRPTEISDSLADILPGYKAGGPVRSIANLVDAFGGDFHFRIVTSDRDHRSSSPYEGVAPFQWASVGKADVMYLPPRCESIPAMVRAIRDFDPDVLYINSFFSPLFSIVPMLLRRLRLIRPKAILLAPRGELGKGALRLKMWKKFPFRKLAHLIGLHGSVLWHASTQYEAGDILAEFLGSDIAVAKPLPVHTAYDLPDSHIMQTGEVIRGSKAPGSLRIAFLSRISRMKNLDVALAMLRGLRGNVVFSIYGPVEDPGYWQRCLQTVRTLPENVRVEYRGEVPHQQVSECLAKSDLFFLPTRGENYGHVIVEAMAAGCPVLISDQTPWRNLEDKGVGWDLPLKAPERFRAVLQTLIDMQPEDFRHSRIALGALQCNLPRTGRLSAATRSCWISRPIIRATHGGMMPRRQRQRRDPWGPA